MRSLASLILILVMLAIACGIPQAMHEQQHEIEVKGVTSVTGGETRLTSHQTRPVSHQHSKDNCLVCAMMRTPTMSSRQSNWLVDTGRWVPFVSMLAVSQASQDCPSRLSCRGPPA